jgi:hypothetical protein
MYPGRLTKEKKYSNTSMQSFLLFPSIYIIFFRTNTNILTLTQPLTSYYSPSQLY